MMKGFQRKAKGVYTTAILVVVFVQFLQDEVKWLSVTWRGKEWGSGCDYHVSDPVRCRPRLIHTTEFTCADLPHFGRPDKDRMSARHEMRQRLNLGACSRLTWGQSRVT